MTDPDPEGLKTSGPTTLPLRPDPDPQHCLSGRIRICNTGWEGQENNACWKDHWSNISGAVKRDILVLKGGDPDHTAAAIKGQFSFFKSTSGPSIILSVLKSSVRLLCTAIESFDQCSGSCSFLQWLSRCKRKRSFFSKHFSILLTLCALLHLHQL